MKHAIASIAVAAALAAPGVSLAADSASPRNGVDVQFTFGTNGSYFSVSDRDRYYGRSGYRHGYFRVGRHEAIRIARGYGLARLYDIDFDRGFWELEGRTYRGARIDIEISARSGRVIDVDYGWRGHGRRFGHHAHRNDHGRHFGPNAPRRWDYDRGRDWRDHDRRDRDWRDDDRRDRDGRDRDGRGGRDGRRGH